MKLEKACYSYSKLAACVERVRELPNSVEKKAQHLGVCYGDLKRAYDFCFEQTDCCLFDADYSPWRDYADKVNQKTVSKAILDHYYTKALRFLQNELSSIRAMMDSGEVDSVR